LLDCAKIDPSIQRLARRSAVLERLGWNALAFAPFRTFFLANFAGNSSWFVFNAGFGWLVLTLTATPEQPQGSAAIVGLAYFINGLPFLLLTLHAGLLTDRFGARPLVAISFALTGMVMIAMGALALATAVPLWLIIGLAFISGATMTLGAPGYVSIVNDLVPPGVVSSGVALNFLGISVGRIVGGFIGGILVATVPAAWALVAAGLLQAVPSIPVWRLPIPNKPQPVTAASRSLFRPLIDATAYGRRFPTLGVILAMSAVPGALGLSYNYLLPVAARDLGIGGGGLGLLLAMAGAGGLIAGLTAERGMRSLGHGRAMLLGLGISSIGMLIFGLSPIIELSVLAMPLVGGGFILYSAATLTLIQALAPEAVRGRLTALFALLYWGLMPIGGLLGGIVAQATSARFAFAAAGLIILTTGLLAALLRQQIATMRVDRDGTTFADGVVVNLAA
jgi:MFS family permease